MFNEERKITMKATKKFIGRILAMVMVVTMVLALPIGVNVVKAADAAEPSFSVVVQKRAKVYSPDTTFTFTVSPVATTPDGYYGAPTTGVAFKNGVNTLTSTPDDGNLSATYYTVGSLTLTVDKTKFVDGSGNVQPGKYRYEVKQTAGSYEGITYDTVTRYLDVVIGSDGTILSSSLIRNDAKNDTFVNRYGVKGNPTNPSDPTNPGDPDGKVNDLVVKKIVEGNVASTTKEFNFTIKITGTQAKEWYYVEFSDGSAAKTVKTDVDNNTISFKLSHNETAKVYGLSATDAYVVEETDANQDGYETTVSEGDANSTVATSDSLVIQKVTIKNTKNETPTGIFMEYMPYALLVILAGAVAIVFCRRRKNSEI